jgi:hypothetical protein
MSDDEAPVIKTKKKCTEKQLESLRMGMEKMKQKREAIAKEREDHEKKKVAGEIPADAPKPKYVPEPKKEKLTAPAPVIPLVTKERKPRVNKPRVDDEIRSEFASLRTELASLKKPAEVKVEVVEKPVDRIVEKTRVVSGSELLNSIFFK